MPAAYERDEKVPNQDPIEQQAAAIFNRLIEVIRTHSQGPQRENVAALKAVIQKCLLEGFEPIQSNEEKSKLRRRLALLLHPDKDRLKNSKVYAHLQSLDAESEPFRCLNAFKDSASIINEVSRSPLGWVQKVFTHFSAIVVLRGQADPEAIHEQILSNHQAFENQIPFMLSALAEKYNVSIGQFGLKKQWHRSDINGDLLPISDTQFQTIMSSLGKDSDPSRVGLIASLSVSQRGKDLRQAMKNLAVTLSVKELNAEDERPQIDQILGSLNKTREEIAASIGRDTASRVNQLQDQIDQQHQALNSLAPGLFFALFTMGDDLNRYVPPFRWLAKLILYPFIGVLGLGGLFAFLGVILLARILQLVLIKMLRKPLGFFINLLTSGQYNKNVKAYEAAALAKAYSDNMEMIRQQNPSFASYDDDDVFAAASETLSQQGIKNKQELLQALKKQLALGFGGFLTCSLGALWHSLTSVPNSFGEGLIWVLSWIPRLALGLALSLVGGVLEAVNSITGIVMVSAFALSLAVYSLVKFIVNLPLYLLVDLPRALVRGIVGLCCGSEAYPEPSIERQPLIPSAQLAKQRDSGATQEQQATAFEIPIIGKNQQQNGSMPNASDAAKVSPGFSPTSAADNID